jgi:hypothetical protein
LPTQIRGACESHIQEREAPNADSQLEIHGTEARRLVTESENPRLSIDESFDPDSNLIVERERQSEKHSGQRVTTDGGMQMDKSDEHFENARASTDESPEADSNTTVERDLYRLVHPENVSR